MDEEIHNNIRKLRLLRELTQENVANELGISHVSYGRIERGQTKVSLKHLKRLAEIFGVPVWAIEKFHTKEIYQKQPLPEVVQEAAEKYVNQSGELLRCMDKNEILKLENEFLKREIQYLKEINEMLKKSKNK